MEIFGLYQFVLFGSIPAFDLFFTFNSESGTGSFLEVNQLFDIVLSRKAILIQMVFMLVSASYQVTRYANIKHLIVAV